MHLPSAQLPAQYTLPVRRTTQLTAPFDAISTTPCTSAPFNWAYGNSAALLPMAGNRVHANILTLPLANNTIPFVPAVILMTLQASLGHGVWHRFPSIQTPAIVVDEYRKRDAVEDVFFLPQHRTRPLRYTIHVSHWSTMKLDTAWSRST
jgi:hypothetical protein